MKTNHSRSFTACQDFKAGYRMIHKASFKEATNRGLRCAEAQILRCLQVGYLDVDEVVFPSKNEIENAWSWD